MIIDLREDTQSLLEKVKKELGQPSSDNEIIKDALTCYYVDVVQINRQKNRKISFLNEIIGDIQKTDGDKNAMGIALKGNMQDNA